MRGAIGGSTFNAYPIHTAPSDRWAVEADCVLEAVVSAQVRKWKFVRLLTALQGDVSSSIVSRKSLYPRMQGLIDGVPRVTRRVKSEANIPLIADVESILTRRIEPKANASLFVDVEAILTRRIEATLNTSLQGVGLGSVIRRVVTKGSAPLIADVETILTRRAKAKANTHLLGVGLGSITRRIVTRGNIPLIADMGMSVARRRTFLNSRCSVSAIAELMLVRRRPTCADIEAQLDAVVAFKFLRFGRYAKGRHSLLQPQSRNYGLGENRRVFVIERSNTDYPMERQSPFILNSASVRDTGRR